MVYLFLFVSLFTGFLLSFLGFETKKFLKRILMQTEDYLSKSNRRRLLENRKRLVEIESDRGILQKLDQHLLYAGIYRRFHDLNIEIVIVANMIIAACGCIAGTLLKVSFIDILIFTTTVLLAEFFYISLLRLRNLRLVEGELLKFLDFVGNYSATAGELTSLFETISRYMEEPLSGALDECFYEAGVTGDVNMALLSLSDKIEHPQFKEIIRNFEIGIRYSADFKTLVGNSKKSVREYIKAGGENRNVLTEAGINMFILGIMSVVIIVMVENMTGISMTELILHSLPGKISMVIFASICILFARQIYGAHQ